MGFFLKKSKIKTLYKTSENSGCLASNRITIDGMPVGYMYREKSDAGFPDSGWRFFAGDENEEYTSDPNNFKIYDLNTICNYDSKIIPFLNSDFGVAFFRHEDIFVEEKLVVED